MKAYEHQAAIDKALDDLAGDGDIDTAEFQRVLSDVEHKASGMLRATIEEFGDQT